jgi:uncharacterized coiled-coil protein SlyX
MPLTPDEMKRRSDEFVIQTLNTAISNQQSDIIALELERDALKEEIKKLQERNNNQAKLLVAIEEGRAKKSPNGGWYTP